MSNTNTSKHRIPFYRRPLFIGGAIILIAAVGIFIIIHHSSSESTQDSSTTDQSPQTQTSTDSRDPQDSDSKPSVEPERPTQYEGDDPNQLPELTGFISYKNVDHDLEEILISAGIDQYLMSEGSCTLRLKQGENVVYSVSVSALADVTTSVCETFRIPLSNLSPGDYQIEISIDADNKTGIITDSIQF